jgi:hypothetical protein
MEFSEKELKLIAAAKKKSSDSRIKRAAVFLSVGMPQFGDGPKYEDLVKLLESKSRNEK